MKKLKIILIIGLGILAISCKKDKDDDVMEDPVPTTTDNRYVGTWKNERDKLTDACGGVVTTHEKSTYTFKADLKYTYASRDTLFNCHYSASERSGSFSTIDVTSEQQQEWTDAFPDEEVQLVHQISIRDEVKYIGFRDENKKFRLYYTDGAGEKQWMEYIKE